MSWRIDIKSGQVFFANDGSPLIKPSSNELNVSASESTVSVPSDYTLELIMGKNRAALQTLELNIPAGYSVGGTKAPRGTLLGVLSVTLDADNEAEPGKKVHFGGVVVSSGEKGRWLLVVDYNDNLTGSGSRNVEVKPASEAVRVHEINVTTPSSDSVGKLTLEIARGNDPPQNQATETWKLKILGEAVQDVSPVIAIPSHGTSSFGGLQPDARVLDATLGYLVKQPGQDDTGLPLTPTLRIVTNPATAGVKRWNGEENTTIDVVIGDTAFFHTIPGRQCVLIKSGPPASVVNSPPIVTITSPAADGTFTDADTISFAGTVTDAEDGNLTASLVWTLSTGVEIGRSGSFSTALPRGLHTITATVLDSGSLTGSANITITVTASLTSLEVFQTSGTIDSDNPTAAFSAEGTFSDGTKQDLTTSVTWFSFSPQFATIDATGLAKGVAKGDVTIKATKGIVTATVSLKVKAPKISLQVTPLFAIIDSTSPTVAFSATATNILGTAGLSVSGVEWSSSNDNVASIDPATGVATGVAEGTVVITATKVGNKNTVTGTASLTVAESPTSAPPLTPLTLTAFVANNGSRTVSVVDADTWQILSGDEIDFGNSGRPETLASTPDGRLVYAPISRDDVIKVIDVGTRSVVETIAAGERPQGIVMTPDGQFAYVAHQDDEDVRVLDLSTNTFVETIGPLIDIPQEIVITPDGSHVYLANADSSPQNVLVIETTNNTALTSVDVSALAQGDGPWGVTALPDGTRVYTNDGPDGQFVYAIDSDPSSVTFNQVAQVIPMCPDSECGPSGMDSGVRPDDVRPEGVVRVYLALRWSDEVVVIDPVENKIVARVPTGDSSEPTRVRLNPDGSELWVSLRGFDEASGQESNEVLVLDTAQIELTPPGPEIDRISGFSDPAQIAFVGSTAFVLNRGTGTLFVVEPDGDDGFQIVSLDEIDLTENIENGGSGRPSTLALAPENADLKQFLYVPVANEESGAAVIQVINVEERNVETTITVGVGDGPKGIVITPDGQFAYIAHKRDKDVRVLRLSDNIFVDKIAKSFAIEFPQEIAITPDGSHVYLANAESFPQNVLVIETLTNTQLTAVDVSEVAVGDGPWGITALPDGTRVYSNDGQDGEFVYAIDSDPSSPTFNQLTVDSDPLSATFNEVTGVIRICSAGEECGPRGMESGVTPAGMRVYLALRWSNEVVVIDPATNEIVRVSTGPGTQPTRVRLNPDGTELWVSLEDSNEVLVLDTATNEEIALITGFDEPAQIAFVWSDIDGDGIQNNVDTQPDVFSTDFSDVGFGGATTGTITDQGDQTLTVGDESPTINQLTGVIPICPEDENCSPRGMDSGVAPLGVRVYAALEESEEVVVIDPATNEIVARVPTGTDSPPMRMRLNPDGTELWVSLEGTGEVLVFDTATYTEIARITGFSEPAQIAFAGSTAFVVNSGAGTVSVVDTGTLLVSGEEIDLAAPLFSRPSTLALTPDGQLLYVPVPGNDNGVIKIIDVADRSVSESETITVGVSGESPKGIVITPDGLFAYIAFQGDNDVRVLDLTTNTFIPSETITNLLLGSPQEIVITPDCNHVYLASSHPPSVLVIETDNNTVVGAVDFSHLGRGNGPWGITVLPDGKRVYSNDGNFGESIFQIDFDPSSPTFIQVPGVITACLPDGEECGPRGMDSGMTPDGMRVYAALAESNEVVVIDPANNTIVARVPTGPDSRPRRVRLNPDGTELWVSLQGFRDSVQGSNEVLILATNTNTEITRITGFTEPAQIAFGLSDVNGDGIQNDGLIAFVLNRGTATVSAVDTADREILPGFEIDFDVSVRPAHLALAPDGKRLYVPISSDNPGDNMIKVISVEDQVVETITVGVGEKPKGIVITPDGQFAYIAHNDDEDVRVLDLNTNTFIKTISSRFIDNPQEIVITPDGSQVYLANAGFPENVLVIETATNTVVGAVDLSNLGGGSGPWGVTALPDGTKVYTNDGRSGGLVFQVSTDPPPDEGVRITADPSGGAAAATISACGGAATITLQAGDEVLVTCGGISIVVIAGTVAITLEATDGTIATTSLAAGNGLAFDPETLAFTAPSANTGPVVILVDGRQVTLEPGFAVTAIDFENAPGPDGELGTEDDVPLIENDLIDDEFASLGVTFSLRGDLPGGDAPIIAAKGDPRAAFGGPSKNDAPTKSGANSITPGAGPESGCPCLKSLQVDFAFPVSSVSIFVLDFDSTPGQELHIIAFDDSENEIARGTITSLGFPSGDGAIQELSVAAPGIRRVKIDTDETNDNGIAFDDLSFVS